MNKMQNETKRINSLFDKYLNGSLTEAERQEFLDYVEDPLFQFQINTLLSEAFDNQTELRDVDISERQLLLDQILKKDSLEKQESKIRLWPRIGTVAAAIATVIVSAGIWFYSSSKNNGKQDVPEFAHDVAPGKNGATLTLGNGRKILITGTSAGKIATEAGVKISKTKDGQLVYEVIEKSNVPITYNTLTTTQGEQSQVLLPDGTQVWLNAASSIKYPATFNGNTRIVELTGEAYFQVSHDKSKPFLVKTPKESIEVLGTHFNVNSYADEPVHRTTLLQGRIRIVAGSQTAVLTPNRQAEIGTDLSLKINGPIDPEEAVAWKNGFFQFHHADIKTVMRQFSRWYDVSVSYEGKLPDYHFSGEIHRNLTAAQALDILSLSKIHYKIESTSNGKRIIITP